MNEKKIKEILFLQMLNTNVMCTYKSQVDIVNCVHSCTSGWFVMFWMLNVHRSQVKLLFVKVIKVY